MPVEVSSSGPLKSRRLALEILDASPSVVPSSIRPAGRCRTMYGFSTRTAGESSLVTLGPPLTPSDSSRRLPVHPTSTTDQLPFSTPLPTRTLRKSHCCCPPRLTVPSTTQLAATPPLTQLSPSYRFRSPITWTRLIGAAWDTVHLVPSSASTATFSIDLQKVSRPLPRGGRSAYFSRAGTCGPLAHSAKRTSPGRLPRPTTEV
mmetsp:Transcript_2693/g.5980  ORF Transcript_2693/g.5980 Transcript_2693/m.5980 type:complete len:204 (-) Transcript_2693:640-1251(-)